MHKFHVATLLKFANIFFQDNSGQTGAIGHTSASKVFQRYGRIRRSSGSAETELPEELERDDERIRSGETDQETKISEQEFKGEQGASRIESGRFETGLRVSALPKILRLELQPGEGLQFFFAKCKCDNI